MVPTPNPNIAGLTVVAIDPIPAGKIIGFYNGARVTKRKASSLEKVSEADWG